MTKRERLQSLRYYHTAYEVVIEGVTPADGKAHAFRLMYTRKKTRGSLWRALRSNVYDVVHTFRLPETAKAFPRRLGPRNWAIEIEGGYIVRFERTERDAIINGELPPLPTRPEPRKDN